jgi:hypothetical protein
LVVRCRLLEARCTKQPIEAIQIQTKHDEKAIEIDKSSRAPLTPSCGVAFPEVFAATIRMPWAFSNLAVSRPRDP